MMGKELESFDGVRIHYRYFRGGTSERDAPVLIFIHGLGGNSSAWEPVIRFFEKKDYPTLYFDVRGHGKSGKPRRVNAYRFENNARDLYEIVKREGISKVIIMGHSSGGMIGLNFYKLYPERVAGLVLMSSNYTNPLRYFLFPVHYLTYPVKLFCYLLSGVGFLFGRKKVVYTNYYLYRHSSEIYLLWRDMLGTPLEIFLWCFVELLDFDARGWLAEIKVPVLLIAGSADWFTRPSASQYMHEKIGDSRLYMVNSTEHDILFKRVDETSRIILSFLEKYSITQERQGMKKESHTRDERVPNARQAR